MDPHETFAAAQLVGVHVGPLPAAPPLPTELPAAPPAPALPPPERLPSGVPPSSEAAPPPPMPLPAPTPPGLPGSPSPFEPHPASPSIASDVAASSARHLSFGRLAGTMKRRWLLMTVLSLLSRA